VAAEASAARHERDLGVGVEVGGAAPWFVDVVLDYLGGSHGYLFGCVASGVSVEG
jgi:hypothetical protein